MRDVGACTEMLHCCLLSQTSTKCPKQCVVRFWLSNPHQISKAVCCALDLWNNPLWASICCWVFTTSQDAAVLCGAVGFSFSSSHVYHPHLVPHHHLLSHLVTSYRYYHNLTSCQPLHLDTCKACPDLGVPGGPHFYAVSAPALFVNWDFKGCRTL